MDQSVLDEGEGGQSRQGVSLGSSASLTSREKERTMETFSDHLKAISSFDHTRGNALSNECTSEELTTGRNELGLSWCW